MHIPKSYISHEKLEILDGEWRISSRHIITSHSRTLALLEKALHLPPVHRIPDKRQALH